MERKILEWHRSPKRKRDDVDHPDLRSDSTRSSPSRSVMSVTDARSPDVMSPGRSSPQVAVTGRLRSLDIHETTRPGDPPEDHPPQPVEIDGHHEGETSPSRKLKKGKRPLSTETPPRSSKKRLSKSISSENSPPKSPSRQFSSSPNMPSRGKSPPLTTQPEENPFTWHESEITCYDPTDPNDDGYGLDGVGFKPTAAIAWDRIQRRKKQIAEWKSRESREERDKRRERRDGFIEEPECQDSPNSRNRKRVKFEA